MEYLSVEIAFPTELRRPGKNLCDWCDPSLSITRRVHELGWSEIYGGFDDKDRRASFAIEARRYLVRFQGFPGAEPEQRGIGKPYRIRSLDGSQMNRVVREVDGLIGVR